MKPEINRSTRFTRIVTPIAFALSIFCLVGVSAQNQDRFYFEPGAENPGSFKPPIIFVKSTKDASAYDTVDVKQGSESDLRFSIRMRGQCPERYRLQNGHITVGERVPRTKVSFQVNTNNRSIGPDHGQGWDYFSFAIPFRMPDIGRSPVEVCNTELKRADGLAGRAKLLREGFDIDFARAYQAELSVQCHKDAVLFHEDPNPYGNSGYLPAVIRCLPTDYKPTRMPVEPKRTPVPDPPIESVSVLADPAETQGRQCPVNVTFRGKITAGDNSAYTIFKTEYRFVGENNFKSDWMPVSLDRGASKTVIWRRFIEAPQNDRAGAFKTPGGRVKIPVYRGWMTVEVKLPNAIKRSERTDFSVDCNVQPRIRTRP